MIKASNWFAPKWQHSDAAIRVEAVACSHDDGLLQALPQIAASDPDTSVRLAALKRCQQSQTFLACLASETDPDNRQLIITRLLEHNAALTAASAEQLQQLTTLLTELQQWQGKANSWAQQQIETLAKQAHCAAVRKLALNCVSKQGLLGDLYCQEQDPQLRSLILASIDQTSTLERISKQLRKHNKVLYQAYLQRLTELQPSAPTAEQAKLQQAQQLLAEFESLLHGKQSPAATMSLQDALGQAHKRWEAIQLGTESAAAQSLQTRWQAAISILQQAATAPPKAPAQDSDDSSAQTDSAAAANNDPTGAATPDQPQVSLQRLAAQLDALLARRCKHEQQLQQHLQPWREQWRAQWQKLNAISRADQQLQDQLVNRIAAEQQRLQAKAETKHASLQQLQLTLEQALELASDGKLLLACGLNAQLQQQIEQLAGPQQQQFNSQHAASLRQLQTALDELRKWQRWSDNQQRRGLLKTLREAKDNELSMDALLNLVKDSKHSWQLLETSEIQAGLRPLGKDHALNRQFHGVCAMLMRSAKPFLKNRNTLRQERATIILELFQATDELLADSQVKSTALLQQKRKISAAFQDVGNVAGEQRKDIIAGLRQRQNQLAERIKQLSADIENDKRRLIRLAEQLAHNTDHHSAVNEAKQLQRQWQQLGVLPRKLEQTLWEAFRAPLDPLFAEQDQQRQQQQADIQEQLQQQETIVTALTTLLSEPDSQLPTLRGQFEELQQQFRQLAKPERRLQQQLRQLSDQFESRLQQALQQRENQYWQASATSALQRQQAIETFLQSATQQQADLDEQLLAMSPAELQTHLQAQSEQARMACIAAEFMAGLPSPAADRQTRMEYQVNRLSQHLRDKEQQSPDQQLRLIRERWYASMPMLPADHVKLKQRFEQAITAAEKLIRH